MDEQQDWIEKYRAALDQQPLRGTARLSAAFGWVAKGFAFALGRIFGKPVGGSENSPVTRRSPEREMKPQPRPDTQTNQRSSREESPRLTPQDKKAS